MKILSLFRVERRKPDWVYTARGTIWRVLVSPGGRIVGECRNQEKKAASFFCLDGGTGSALWEDLRLEEPWWVGIEAVHGSMLFLHGFAKPDMPEHKGIRAFDIETGTQIWCNDELTYWFSFRDNVYAYRDSFEKRVGYALSARTGAFEQTYDEDLEPLLHLRRQALIQQETGGLRFPETMNLDSLDPTHAEIVRRELRNKQLVGGVEGLTEGGFLLFNYHSVRRGHRREVQLLENTLAIFDVRRRSNVFSDILVRDAKAAVPDSFFVTRPFVYFIKDSGTLVGLRLWKS